MKRFLPKTKEKRELLKTLVTVFLVAMFCLAPSMVLADQQEDKENRSKKIPIKPRTERSHRAEQINKGDIFHVWPNYTSEQRVNSEGMILVHKGIAGAEGLLGLGLGLAAAGIDYSNFAKKSKELKKAKRWKRGYLGLSVILIVDSAIRWGLSDQKDPGIFPLGKILINPSKVFNIVMNKNVSEENAKSEREEQEDYENGVNGVK